MNDFQAGPGPICKCCHDDAQGIDGSGLCPSCRKYTAALRAEIERFRNESEAMQSIVADKYEEIADLREEIARIRDLQFRPVGDNHHNAALCPHCGEPLRKALAEIEKLREVSIGLVTAAKVAVDTHEGEYYEAEAFDALQDHIGRMEETLVTGKNRNA